MRSASVMVMPEADGGISHASIAPRISVAQLMMCEYSTRPQHIGHRWLIPSPLWQVTQRSWKIGSTSAYVGGSFGQAVGAVTLQAGALASLSAVSPSPSHPSSPHKTSPTNNSTRMLASLARASSLRYASRAMGSIGRTLLFIGIALAASGALLLLGERLGLGKLPGDFIWKKKNVTVYFPLATSIIVSIVLTLVLNLWLRRK